MVPTKWVKFLVALFLLPVVWISTKTFFGVFAYLAIEKSLWQTPEFLYFGAGTSVWLLAFYLLPRPLWIYVFGHELTHALWVWMMGGKVEQMKVSSQGGLILADRINTWIALAPYFFPIYSVLLIAGYGITGLFTDLSPWRNYLFAGIGFTWAFHFTFTCWMIPKGQSDLHYGGNFFSLVIIYLANLSVLTVLLIVGSPQVTWQIFFYELFHNAMDFLHWCEDLLRRIL